MAFVYIVEDDKNIREIEVIALKNSGYEVQEFETAGEFRKAFEERQPDLLLLDLMLPDADGLDIVRELRQDKRGRELPIILVTARTTEIDKVKGLDIGADDYIVKPFSPGEVMARIRAVLRRIPAVEEKETLVVGELSIHLPSLSVALSGHKLNLTRREVELLYTLASAPGRVFTRDNLLTMVWGYEFLGNYRAVDSHIKRLRAKLDVYPHESFAIATVWGAGYKFERKLP